MFVKVADLIDKNDYIVMDEQGMFFAGMMFGEFIWTYDIKEAKPIQTERQLNNLMLWTRKNLIWDSISTPRAKGVNPRKKKKV
jgi:hypothetical protein